LPDVRKGRANFATTDAHELSTSEVEFETAEPALNAKVAWVKTKRATIFRIRRAFVTLSVEEIVSL
jgi:hypothetical protein